MSRLIDTSSYRARPTLEPNRPVWPFLPFCVGGCRFFTHRRNERRRFSGNLQRARTYWTAGARALLVATLCLVGFLLAPASASPQTAGLLRNVWQGSGESNPAEMVVLGGVLYFSADDGVHGHELWRSDGTPGGTNMVKDIFPGAVGSLPFNLTAGSSPWGPMLYFSCLTFWGVELWRSDGTEAGTRMVKDISPGLASSWPDELTNVNGVLYFAVGEPYYRKLWKSDGTEAGTTTVSSAFPLSNPEQLTAAGTTLYFLAESITLTGGYQELFKSDGTVAGTVLVADLNGTFSPRPTDLTMVGGTLYFSANETNTGRELWKSDGTAAGTMIVEDIAPGPVSSSPHHLTEAGGWLFFSAKDTSDLPHDTELWWVGGSGVERVKDILPGPYGSQPRDLTSLGGLLYFSAESETGRGLWRSDGSDLGTWKVADVFPTHMTGMTAAGGYLFFEADDGTHGAELWRWGLDTGAVMVADIRPGETGSLPRHLIDVGGQLFFAADDGIHRNELWTSDGTEAGTGLVLDIWSSDGDSLPAGFVAAGETIFFTAIDEATGRELWSTDGTSEATSLVKDINTGPEGSAPGWLAAVGGELFFAASKYGSGPARLWTSDGTSAGTHEVAADDDLRDPAWLTDLDGVLLFSAEQASDRELWRSNGTAEDTWQVKNINPGFVEDSDPKDLVVAGGRLFFTADDGTSGRELWVSDGTESGTELIEINFGTAGSSPAWLTPVGDLLYFVADDGVNGRELWRSNGTVGSTYQVADPWGGGSSAPEWLAAIGDTLFFSAFTPSDGRELWRSDASGTEMVRDIVGGSGSSFPGWLTAQGDTLFFTALDGSGFELWKSDGTESGTRQVADIGPGHTGSNPGNLEAVDGLLYFTATDGATGIELWQSDGTEIGTIQVRDIYPGIPGSLPGNLAAANGHLFFAAGESRFGIEPWSVPAASAPLTLRIEVDGSGTGLVTSQPAGIQCGADCAEVFDLATSVALLAVPDYGSRFEGWDGDPDCEHGQVTIDANKTCQVTFSPCSLFPEGHLGAYEVTSLEFFEVCNELWVGNGFTVKFGGDARFRAGNLIVLENDFVVESGGAMVAAIGPP